MQNYAIVWFHVKLSKWGFPHKAVEVGVSCETVQVLLFLQNYVSVVFH